jgi:hypothetical protein
LSRSLRLSGADEDEVEEEFGQPGASSRFKFWVAELVKSFDPHLESPKVLTTSATPITLIPNLDEARGSSKLKIRMDGSDEVTNPLRFLARKDS